MRMSRGIYRGGYSVLVDDPDFQALSAAARHVLLTMRWSAEVTIACIWLLEVPRLAKRTGYPPAICEQALVELASKPSPKKPWIFRDGDIVWIRNGLRYDPQLNLANPNHMKGILRSLATLPYTPLLAKFCQYYDLPKPLASHPRAIHKPSVSHPPAIPDPKSYTESKTKTKTESSRARSAHAPGSDSSKPSDPDSDAAVALIARALKITPAEVRRRQQAARNGAKGEPTPAEPTPAPLDPAPAGDTTVPF